MKISFNESQKLCGYTAVMLVLAVFFYLLCVSAIRRASDNLHHIACHGSRHMVRGNLRARHHLTRLICSRRPAPVVSDRELYGVCRCRKSAGAGHLGGLRSLLFSYIAGRIHELAKGLERSVKQSREEITSFVAVDRVTGFDNHLRMKLELSEEIKRAERYGNSFVFLLPHMHYFKEFKSLYGEKRDRPPAGIYQPPNPVKRSGNRQKIQAVRRTVRHRADPYARRTHAGRSGEAEKRNWIRTGRKTVNTSPSPSVYVTWHTERIYKRLSNF